MRAARVRRARESDIKTLANSQNLKPKTEKPAENRFCTHITRIGLC